MALLPVQLDLHTLFLPVLQTQSELARTNDLICQVDDVSDFIDDIELHEGAAHLRAVRHHLIAVRTLLKLRLTIQLVQLARRFRQHFQNNANIPIVNLDFR
jgi:hypothetical protein